MGLFINGVVNFFFGSNLKTNVFHLKPYKFEISCSDHLIYKQTLNSIVKFITREHDATPNAFHDNS